ncbi:ABC transporter substrate-binding protein [Undibacterium pigrum]|uniref:Amino acid/amide ABC transporter substrate-binding protein (HAAT family) n=1 Tax=Undibacterium pigrum TaxID=401470 RepID=A0A318J5N0_9BURK|nr:ABC transporter substrate-binding protein [Undibacterium pigrum]PXX41941.1 amino acid/amide ABC transporter substrate-binding protein (HAAT family) [Undibacterium pigrum]
MRAVPQLLAGLLLTLSLPMYSHADEGNQGTQATIRIGIIGPFTGKSSTDMGESIRGGARVFLQDINQIGGVMGRRIELVERDDQAKPELGVAMAKELVDKEKVVAVIGIANTGVALQAAKVFQDSKKPLIITAATGAAVTKQYMPPAIPDSYVFRLAASDNLQPSVILSDVIDKRKLTQIAILHDDSPYGMYGKENLMAEMQRRKITPVALESFKVGDQDMTAQLSKAKQGGAQVVVVYCLSSEGAMVANSMSKIKLNVPLAGSWTLSQRSFAELAGGNAEGTRMPVTFIENDASNRSNDFVLNYFRINNVKSIPSAVAAAQTYDALRILTLALMQANTTDGDKIKLALEDMKYDTTSTVISRYKKPFSKNDHEAIARNMLFIGEIRRGKVAYAYKEDANSSLIVRTK